MTAEKDYDIMTSENKQLREGIAAVHFKPSEECVGSVYDVTCVYSFCNYCTDPEKALQIANVYRQMVEEMLGKLEIEATALIKDIKPPKDFYSKLTSILMEKILEITNGVPKYFEYLSDEIQTTEDNCLQKVNLKLDLLIAPGAAPDSDLIWIITINGLKRQNLTDVSHTLVELEQTHSLEN
jgi:hypothetical protein